MIFLGVNGVGKTTTIGKLAAQYRGAGQKVLLVAGDTFRAAAIEQLDVWGQRVGVDVVKHRAGADPSAVVFDGIQAAKSRGVDVLLIDTAGRLHTKIHLIEELKKIRRVITREQPDAPHETLLVLDATTGQNGLQQARVFKEATDITGIVLTKLDGTAKGGVISASKKSSACRSSTLASAKRSKTCNPSTPRVLPGPCSKTNCADPKLVLDLSANEHYPYHIGWTLWKLPIPNLDLA